MLAFFFVLKIANFQKQKKQKRQSKKHQQTKTYAHTHINKASKISKQATKKKHNKIQKAKPKIICFFFLCFFSFFFFEIAIFRKKNVKNE